LGPPLERGALGVLGLLAQDVQEQAVPVVVHGFLVLVDEEAVSRRGPSWTPPSHCSCSASRPKGLEHY